MKFFRNRVVAVIICFLMIAVALKIGQMKKPLPEFAPESEQMAEEWGRENAASYLQFIYDEAGVLEEPVFLELSAINAALDYSYESICAIAVVNGFLSDTIEDAAFETGELLGLGENDSILLLDLQQEDWYFACGTEMEYYLNHELEILVTSYMDQVFADPNDTLPEFFEELREWYEDYVPVSGQSEMGTSPGMVVSGVVIFVLLITILVVASVISALCRFGRRFYTGFSVRSPFFFSGSRNVYRNVRSGPGSGHTYRPGSGVKFTSRPKTGGFGGSNRGNFSRGGGFGGSSRSGSRGGGFGKR